MIFLTHWPNPTSALSFDFLKINKIVIAKNIEVKIGKDVIPIATPKTPAPRRTRDMPSASLTPDETMDITGNGFVFKEDTMIERSKSAVIDDAINTIAIINRSKSILKVSRNQS